MFPMLDHRQSEELLISVLFSFLPLLISPSAYFSLLPALLASQHPMYSPGMAKATSPFIKDMGCTP
jgi:hypothetical protein